MPQVDLQHARSPHPPASASRSLFDDELIKSWKLEIGFALLIEDLLDDQAPTV